jgi:glycosyltransferase involved in cell wall biosynthesis
MSQHPPSPFISVVMPVFNGAATLDRAVRSVRFQTFSGWELIAADDCSTDDSLAILQRWAGQDGRIRIEHLEENRGVSAARNAAILAARGEFVGYLDQDDEYYTDHLAHVWELKNRGDVLMFGYDFVYEDGPAGGRLPSWDPGQARQHMFAACISTPLGVAHRREWWEKVGGFNEAWCEEDSDLWRRMARAGARYDFLPLKSGLYHVRRDSASRAPHITRRQRDEFLANWQAGRPMYGDRPPGSSLHKVERIAFVSTRCMIDPTGEAARATLDALGLLAELGFSCEALCGPRSDSREAIRFEEILARRDIRYEAQDARIGPYGARLVFTAHGKVPMTLFDTGCTRVQWRDEQEVNAFLAVCEWFLKKNRPDAVWTCGGDAVALQVQQIAKHLDIPVLFALHDLSFRDTAFFKSMDYVVVPNEFCRQHYWKTLGLACQKLPPVIDRGRVVAGTRQPESLTFVDPEPRKGAFLFARIAEQLARRRPDIPILLVQGTGQADPLRHAGIDAPRNFTVTSDAPDPHQFFARTKVLLMPSLEEDFGLVACEAILNGIPVVASNRGALPELVGDAGFLLQIPDQYTADTRILPTVEEAEPWVETILRLWDDREHYEHFSRKARDRSQLWQPEHLGPIYREFLGNLCHRPGPPLVSKDAMPTG